MEPSTHLDYYNPAEEDPEYREYEMFVTSKEDTYWIMRPRIGSQLLVDSVSPCDLSVHVHPPIEDSELKSYIINEINDYEFLHCDKRSCRIISRMALECNLNKKAYPE